MTKQTGRRGLASSVHSGVRACGEKPQLRAAGFDPPDLGLLGFEPDDEPDDDPDDELPEDDPDDGALGVFAAGAAVSADDFMESEPAASAFGELDESEVDSELLEPGSVEEDPPSGDDFAPTAAACRLSVR